MLKTKRTINLVIPIVIFIHTCTAKSNAYACMACNIDLGIKSVKKHVKEK